MIAHPTRLVMLPEPDECCVCGTPVMRGLLMSCGDGVSDFQVGLCDFHWQLQLRELRAHGELDEWVRYARLKSVESEKGA